MQEQDFQLKAEFIPLMGLLKHAGIAATGGHAGLMITEGEVMVNGQVELQKRKKIRAGDVVEVEGVKVNVTS